MNNIDQLRYNYKSRYKFIKNTAFSEYCDYIYTGMKIGAWLPVEYTIGIIYKEAK
tara:strand:+ start:730 stop:894 length:165 start_codon:yes stop_codon:yes gene_type:complete